MKKVNWKPAVSEKDYEGAWHYLILLFPEAEVNSMIAKLKKAKVMELYAKDIFRASRLSMLGISNERVIHERKKIKQGKPLLPLLLVRDPQNRQVLVADGYHRLCAIYSLNEREPIHCKIV